MIKKKRFMKFQINRKTIIFFIVVALVVLVQLHKISITLNQQTIEGDNLYSEINIIDNGKMLYFDDNIYVLFSDGSNIIHYYNHEGDFLYSLSLSSYSTVDIIYNQTTNQYIGYYYRSRSVGIIR